MRRYLITGALAGVLLAPAPLPAQREASPSGRGAATGLVLGIHVTGGFVTVDGATFEEHTFGDRGREGGGGMHLTLGYAFTPRAALLLHGGAIVLAEQDERTFGGVELAFRYGLAEPARRVVPYLEMALGGFALEDGRPAEASELAGGSLSAAAGLNLFLTRRLALNVDFRYNMGMFTSVTVGSRTLADDARIGFTQSRVNVGLNWYPMAGR